MGDSPEESATVSEEISMLVEQAKELQETASSLISRTSREEDALRQRVASLDAHINSLRSSFRSSKNADKLEEELARARYVLSEGDAAAHLPSKSHGRFLRLFLGPINVRANGKDVQLKVKDEYYNFRDRTAYMFLCLPLLLLVLRLWIWDGCLLALPVQLYQAWLLYLYTGLALRENILRVNGSDIRPWWIKHHYCSMAMALVSLTWGIEKGPDCAQKQRGMQLFLKWAIMQGFAMILQNRYQRQRLYTRIALGKARRMDVVWGETAGVEGQLLLLFPVLFALQICEARVQKDFLPARNNQPYHDQYNYNSLHVGASGFFGDEEEKKGFEAYVGCLYLKTVLTGISSDWQVIVCGILLIIMAVGNFANTVQTLVTKSRVKAKIKKGKSRVELNQAFDDKSL